MKCKTPEEYTARQHRWIARRNGWGGISAYLLPGPAIAEDFKRRNRADKLRYQRERENAIARAAPKVKPNGRNLAFLWTTALLRTRFARPLRAGFPTVRGRL